MELLIKKQVKTIWDFGKLQNQLNQFDSLDKQNFYWDSISDFDSISLNF